MLADQIPTDADSHKYTPAVYMQIIPVLVGATVFVVFQIIIRIPLLQYVMPKKRWYTDMAYNPWLDTESWISWEDNTSVQNPVKTD